MFGGRSDGGKFVNAGLVQPTSNETRAPDADDDALLPAGNTAEQYFVSKGARGQRRRRRYVSSVM